MKKSFLILFLILFLGGCGRTPAIFDSAKLESKNLFANEKEVEENAEYQYAAPWDKDFFDLMYKNIKDVPDIGEVKGGIVPHHLLAGYMDATMFDYLAKQKPSTVLIIGPNHFSRGNGAPIISTGRNWQTVYGKVETDKKLLKKLGDIIAIDEEAIKEEHSVYGLIPFVKKSLPKASVLPLILRNDMDEETTKKLVEKLIEVLPSDAVILASIDFSHYQTLPVGNLHDEVTINVIETFDYNRFEKLEIDSVPSLKVLMKLMENFGTQKIGFALHDNSAMLVHNADALNNTSYYSPYFIKGEPEEETAVGILHFGDLMLDRSVKTQIDNFGEDYLLEELAGEEGRFFRGLDIVTANLEGPFVQNRIKTSKEIAFRFDPALLSMLERYNFNLFTTGNNHSIDMGQKGFAESNEYLQKAGVGYYGGDGYTVRDSSLYYEKIGDVKVAFVGANDTFSSMNEQKVLDLIVDAEKNAEHTIVSIHWGQEYKPVSNIRQRTLAHTFVDAGADVVVGHHPHVVQEMEIYNNRPIFYSLGNFVFDQYWSPETQVGLGVGMVLYPHGVSTYLFPLQGEKSQVKQIVDTTQKNAFFSDFFDKSRLGGYTIENNNLFITYD